jgi:hypothetical protein
MGVPVEEGSLGHAQDDQETVDRGPGFRPLSPAVAVVGMRPDGALASRLLQVSGGRWPKRSHVVWTGVRTEP